MTKKQFELLKYVRNRILHTGIAPTYREMRDHMEVSSNQTINDLLLGLEREAYISVKKGANRGIEITSKASESKGQQALDSQQTLRSNFTSIGFTSSASPSVSNYENSKNRLYDNKLFMKGVRNDGTT